MANYESVTRSNYFHVKDEDAFSKFMDTVSGDDMHCWSDKDEDGNTLHAFGCDGSIYGVPNGAKDNDFDLFLSELQKHIAPEDAVILMESGHEKLRYVTGFATVITSGGIETISIDELAISKASGIKDRESALQRFHEYHEMDPDKYARAIIRDNMTRKEKTYA